MMALASSYRQRNSFSFPLFICHSFFCYVQDACNSKSNQQNLGTIKSSNLCTEIIEYTAPDETAVCNLASIALPRFVKDVEASPTASDSQSIKLMGSRGAQGRVFDFKKLGEVIKRLEL